MEKKSSWVRLSASATLVLAGLASGCSADNGNATDGEAGAPFGLGGGLGLGGSLGTGGAVGTGGAGSICAVGQELCGDSCVVLDSNTAHCGSCNNACGPGVACVAGVCTCSAPLTDCSGECVNTLTDARHCGGCGVACTAAEVCANGVCTITCPADLTQCGTSCVDVANDPAHCGACDRACVGGQTCIGGSCACAPGQLFCSGTCADVQSDPNNCGVCGMICGLDQSCVAGSCVGGGAGGTGSGGTGSGGSGTGGDGTGGEDTGGDGTGGDGTGGDGTGGDGTGGDGTGGDGSGGEGTGGDGSGGDGTGGEGTGGDGTGGDGTGGQGTGGSGACEYPDPPSDVAAWIDESWAAQLDDNIQSRQAWLLDSAIMGQGQINLCVRWGATTAPSQTVKDNTEAAVGRMLNHWFTALGDYGCFPYPNGVTVKVTGWAVRPGNESWISDLPSSIGKYTEIGNENEPTCPSECSFFDHWDHQFPNCPGGEAFHTDYWVWVSDSLGGGAAAVGGDWGFRIPLSGYLSAIGQEASGVLEHEMGHGFGFQDYYDWTGSRPAGGSLMIVGSAGQATPTVGDTWLIRRTWREMQELRGW